MPERAIAQARDGGLLQLSVRELTAVLRRRDASPIDVIEELADTISSLPVRLNPYVTVDLDLARDTARILQDLPRESVGPLHGLPMSIKDIVPTRDLPTTWGMSALDPTTAPREDGSFVETARRAGVIVYGKTNTPPNAYADFTDNLIVGPTANPHDLNRTAGGSSGGAGAIVAAGIEPLAHGTDAGGSVRMPAAHCGVVGFKPSYGRLPRSPAPDLWNARGHHGLIGRTVDDVRCGMEALVGSDFRDPLSIDRSDWERPTVRARRGRIAFATSLFGQQVDAEVLAVIRSAIVSLSNMGIPVDEVEVCWPDPVDGATQQMAALENHLYGGLLAEKPEQFETGYADYIRLGATVTASELLTAQTERTKLYATASAFMENYDFILTPSLPVTSWKLEETHPLVNGRPIARSPGSRWPDMLLANLLGWPAASIPAGWSAGLPVGLQIIAPWRDDRNCLDFATEAERILQVTQHSPDPRPLPPTPVSQCSH